MQETRKKYQFEGREITISTGKIVNLAQGSLLLQMGETSLLAVVTVDKKDTEADFFPLSVEYIEKMYARGVISTSPFKKREGLPSDEAIIKARQVDHSIRSLFPKGFKKPTSVILTVLSYDQVNDPEPLAVLGASLAIMLSGVPYYGPSSGVVVCLDENNNLVFNPSAEGREKFNAEFLVSGTDSKILNIEGWGKEVSESQMGTLLDSSIERIKELNDIQRDFFRTCRSVEFSHPEGSEIELSVSSNLIEYILNNKVDDVEKMVFSEERSDRAQMSRDIAQLTKDQFETLLSKEDLTEEEKALYKSSDNDIDIAIDYVAKKVLRKALLREGKRRLGRGLDQIRELKAEVDTIPYVHGSALFSRGLTQSLSIATLGSLQNGLLIEGMEGEGTKRFMHHYNMPNYTVGEGGRFGYHPGRREIGHGAIGENALKNMIPSEDDFPYTIRVVSETLTSNGSTSMAATCASSMALMAAGIPIKESVAGISVGLVTEDGNESNYRLLMDIEGIEDFYGDMDFKIAGTRNGITAIQYENKLRGVSIPVLKEAFELAKKGRNQILEAMNQAIAAPRPNLSPNAPIVDSMYIMVDEIGALIGPGGKNIKDLVLRSGEFGKNRADVSVEEDGRVVVTASNKAQLEFVMNEIKTMFGKAEVGAIYTGRIDKVTNYGFFVDVSANISGLCHISEIVDRRLNNIDLSEYFKAGMQVNVKVTKIDNEGRINLSLKGVDQSDQIREIISKLP